MIAAGARTAGWTRRARPLLGTLVEVGVTRQCADVEAALAAAFAALQEVQDCLSRFDASSDIARFQALRVGTSLSVRAPTRRVLAAARELQIASAGVFDISLHTAPDGWQCDAGRLHKLDAATRLDLGGIGKGHAVDCAVQALIDHGCTSGWVNAGGDLRAFGSAELPVQLRDEQGGGVRAFATLTDGAFATSWFGRDSRSAASRLGHDRATLSAHASVAAPLCLWADALTKVVAVSGDARHPLLARYDARAWLH